MPAPHQTFSFGLTDVKVSPLTADPEGGTATYGTAVDVPGVQEFTFKIGTEKKTLRGDNKQLDVRTVITSVTGTVKAAKVGLAVLAAAYGGTVVDSGTGSDEVAEWDLTGASVPEYVKIEGVTVAGDAVGGNMKVTIHKAILGGVDGLGAKDGDYQTPSYEFDAVPLLATGNKWVTIGVYETAETL